MLKSKVRVIRVLVALVLGLIILGAAYWVFDRNALRHGSVATFMFNSGLLAVAEKLDFKSEFAETREFDVSELPTPYQIQERFHKKPKNGLVLGSSDIVHMWDFTNGDVRVVISAYERSNRIVFVTIKPRSGVYPLAAWRTNLQEVFPDLRIAERKSGS